MLSIEYLNERTPTCHRCRGRFRVVLPTKSDQESLAPVSVRSLIEFMFALREATGCGLTDAKGVASHVANTPGRCHYCKHELRERLLADCPQCRSLNIQLGRPAEDVTCPACGFAVLAEGYGSHEICEVCGWEDDGVQLANPASKGGANQRSLAEVQTEILTRIPAGVMTHGEFLRDPRWRPLNAQELAVAEKRSRRRHWHTSTTRRADVYWLRVPLVRNHGG